MLQDQQVLLLEENYSLKAPRTSLNQRCRSSRPQRQSTYALATARRWPHGSNLALVQGIRRQTSMPRGSQRRRHFVVDRCSHCKGHDRCMRHNNLWRRSDDLFVDLRRTAAVERFHMILAANLMTTSRRRETSPKHSHRCECCCTSAHSDEQAAQYLAKVLSRL